jgi:hypothetical protein
MTKFFMPTTSPEDWKRLLAEPDKQWRTGFSAKTLAYCWEQAGGFPESIKQVFLQSGLKQFEELEFLLAFPEYPVPLPGGRRPSYNDIFALAKSNNGLVTITVEGKVAEPFGPTILEWQQQNRQGNK